MTACHGAPVTSSPFPAASTIDKVWLLEASGSAVPDTAVTFAARSGRTVVLRHAAPDDAIFLVLQFAPAADSSGTRDSIHVTIHPVPGKYGFTLATADKLSSGTRATFSYAIHFQAPSDAAVKYPSPGRFEQLLFPCLLTADNHVQFLAGERPAADMLRFAVSAPGSYALAVVR